MKVLASAFLLSKMVEPLFIVGIAILFFLVFLLFSFFSYYAIFTNILLLAILFFLIRRDLKDSDSSKYYIASLGLTALFFIFSASLLVKELLLISERLMLSYATIAIALIYVCANMFAFLHGLAFHNLKRY